MDWNQAKKKWLNELATKLDKQEAILNLNILAEEILPYSKIEIKVNNFDLKPNELLFFETAVTQLLNNEPLQYIISKAWFRGFELFVNENVLIPRPETEELISLIINENKKVNPTILDIGTGSGCIPIALKKEISHSDISAVDVSKEAIKVAKKNAKNLKTNIQFKVVDILDQKQWNQFPQFDIIVSNPPYIPNKEKSLIESNVLDYEPHLALFVENDKPIIFYDKISDFALIHLKNEGKLYFECNEFNAKEVQQLLLDKKYKEVEIIKDLQGKERMIKALIS